MVKMILTYAGFPALFLSTRITPFEAVAVPKTDLIKLFPFHRFGSIYLDYTKCNFTYCEKSQMAHRLPVETNRHEGNVDAGQGKMKGEDVQGVLFRY